ncbi:CHAT domain-containing protein [Gloeopeniophorella convolvens]|nr:CHAT domain-containing protein [Gloeopeniophorella convolvens]
MAADPVEEVRLLHLLASLPLFHPMRPHALVQISVLRLNRFQTSREEDDLNSAINFLAEALLLPSRPSNPHRINPVLTFFTLTVLLDRRFDLTHSDSDIKHVIVYSRHLLGYPLEHSGVNRNAVVLLLFYALRHEVRAGSGPEQHKNVEEMLHLYQHLHSLGDPEYLHVRIPLLIDLAGAHLVTSDEGGQSTHEGAIVHHLREASKTSRHEDFPLLRAQLAQILVHRTRLLVENNLEEAIHLFEQCVSFPTPQISENLCNTFRWRIVRCSFITFLFSSKPEFLEKSISTCRILLEKYTAGSTNWIEAIDMLASMLRRRSKYYGHPEDLEEAESCMRKRFSLAPVSEEKNRLTTDRVNPPDDQTTGYFMTTRDRYIQHECDQCQRLFDLHQTFLQTGEVQCLEDGIRMAREAVARLSRTSGGALWVIYMALLAHGLRLRYGLFERTEDLEESMSIYQAVATVEENGDRGRFLAARFWAAAAHGHPSASLAYEKVQSILENFLATRPTLQARHVCLALELELGHTSASDYASHWAEAGQIERAVETLERGRSFLWSELRGFRTSVDRLSAMNEVLASKFVAVSQCLEEITTSSPGLRDARTALHIHGVQLPDPEQTGPADKFSSSLEERKALSVHREAIISQIRALPSFEHFMKSVPFEILRVAASHGPVIFTNRTFFGPCGVFIILRDAPPSFIPTPAMSCDRGLELMNELLDTRRTHGLDSKQYDRTLRSVLEQLYTHIGQPVIAKLQELGIPEGSRVWWCPTSVFCSLPLHAMGPIPTTGKAKRYFSDVYISSYTPTLSSLIESQARAKEATRSPSLLVIGQPDASLPSVRAEIKAVQETVVPLGCATTALISAEATTPAVQAGLREHNFVHFACHGTLEPERPFEAAFRLYEDDRLTLLDIARERLPHAEFAFLSACHTAEPADLRTPDEALHLAAAMQHCGFRSVVGTMWEMADLDGRDLAAHFYGYMFTEERRDVPFGERSARALQHAVRKLRLKRGMTLERWVNFVHYGA